MAKIPPYKARSRRRSVGSPGGILGLFLLGALVVAAAGPYLTGPGGPLLSLPRIGFPEAAEQPLPDAPRAMRGGAVVSTSFALCGSGRRDDCVIDGDTFRTAGHKVRMADIDAPETHPPRCAFEGRLGEEATDRLLALLNAGPFTLRSTERDADSYGRKLRIVERDGQSLGAVLVSEGLARRWTGHRRPWC